MEDRGLLVAGTEKHNSCVKQANALLEFWGSKFFFVSLVSFFFFGVIEPVFFGAAELRRSVLYFALEVLLLNFFPV